MELREVRAAVLVEQMYQELEVWYPLYRLKEAGCKVTVVGPEVGQSYPSKLGYAVKSDQAARNVSANDFDLLIIPGGYAPDHMRRCEPMIRLASTMAEQGKVVAAICHGPWLLCSTQALKGRKATCFFAIKDDVINAGGQYLDAEVVRDGNIITSRKPDDLPAFMQTILQAAKELQPAAARVPAGPPSKEQARRS
jgi:protease I